MDNLKKDIKASKLGDMTDEEVVREFCRRFEYDAVFFIGIEKNGGRQAFSRWRNARGRVWIKAVEKLYLTNKP